MTGRPVLYGIGGAVWRPSVLRAAVARALDAAFEASSPLSALPKERLAAVSDGLISLPAPSALAPGNQDASGLLHLVLLARLVGARRIFEIGTYNGLTALTLAANVADARVETLDLPPGAAPMLQLSADDAANAAGFSGRLYEGTEHEPRIVQHLGDSATFDFAALGSDFDLVYVDGAHTFEYVENDTRAAFSIVSSTGAVVWDDYWRRVPDVARFLHTISDRQILRIPRTRLAVWLSSKGPGDWAG